MKRPACFPGFFLMFALLASCVEEFTPTPASVPTIPAAEGFAIPTDLLTQIVPTDSDETSQSHWLHSGLNLFAWHRSIRQKTRLHIAALKAAAEVQPKRNHSGEYEWTFSFQAPEDQGEQRYKMRLTAVYELDSQEIAWTLSQDGGGEWLEGTTARDASEGTFFVLPLDGTRNAAYRIAFFQKKTIRRIRYSDLSGSTLGPERYVEYQVDSESEYDQAFEIQGSPVHSGSLIQVEWKATTMEGRVRDAAHFQDYRWHFWDEKQVDVPVVLNER